MSGPDKETTEAKLQRLNKEEREIQGAVHQLAKFNLAKPGFPKHYLSEIVMWLLDEHHRVMKELTGRG